MYLYLWEKKKQRVQILPNVFFTLMWPLHWGTRTCPTYHYKRLLMPWTPDTGWGFGFPSTPYTATGRLCRAGTCRTTWCRDCGRKAGWTVSNLWPGCRSRAWSKPWRPCLRTSSGHTPSPSCRSGGSPIYRSSGPDLQKASWPSSLQRLKWKKCEQMIAMKIIKKKIPKSNQASTWTDDPCVLLVAAVVLLPLRWTLPQVPLLARAVQLIQVDGPAARWEQAPLARHVDGVAAAKLAAHHVSVAHVPLVIAHCAPSTVIPQLHAASAAVRSTGQPHQLILWRAKVTGLTQWRQRKTASDSKHRCQDLQCLTVKEFFFFVTEKVSVKYSEIKLVILCLFRIMQHKKKIFK